MVSPRRRRHGTSGVLIAAAILVPLCSSLLTPRLLPRESRGSSGYRERGCHRPPARLRQLQCISKIPSGDDPYVQLRKQTSEATLSSIASGATQIELEFPPVRGKLDISLGETLDANRDFARELARSFSAKLGRALWLVFPDGGEARLAQKKFGKTPFTVTSIADAIKEGKELDCQMQIVVNPGEEQERRRKLPLK
ncbi:unnamed protein product [Discosporangium mesarthrocarpum]